MIMTISWDRHLEDDWFELVEEKVREYLCVTEDLPARWHLLPQQLAELLSNIAPSPPPAFIADAIATTIGLLIGTWKEYVERFSSSASPDLLVSYLRSRPQLEDFLKAVGWSVATLNDHSSLALTDLQERLCRGEGGTAKEYQHRFGIAIRQPEFNCFVTIQDLDNGAFSVGQSFPVYGSFVVGRQRKHNGEPDPICFLEYPTGNRLVIAGRHQAAQCSREQLLICLLTPQHVYVKNISDVISVKLQIAPESTTGKDVEEHPSELLPQRVQMTPLGCGETVVLRTPFSIVLPTKILRLSKR
jgi:hypothetical protein